MAVEVKELDGREWSDGPDGVGVVRRFRITGLTVGFTPSLNYNGLPKRGDAHPVFTGYVCLSRKFKEGEGKDKHTVIVTVNYGTETTEGGGEGTEGSDAVEEYGWDDATEDKELVSGADGTPVVNSAGDPFESVPTVPTPAQVFTKVVKTKQLKSGALDYMCKVNSSAVTIMGKTCAAGTLLCTISPRRIFGDTDWKYSYTIKLKYKSNPVNINGDSTVTECGWDVCVTDAGMRAKQTVGGEEKVALIKQIDPETGKMCTVTSAALLDGNGYARTPEDQSEVYNFRFQAYERTTFPSWFYSEPL